MFQLAISLTTEYINAYLEFKLSTKYKNLKFKLG